jgi:hypothetical protein
MASIPKQYSNFQNLPDNLLGGLSPLQLAAAYYMIQGQQVPFFVNHDWLRALRVYCDSGIVNPRQVGGSGPVVVKGDDVYTIERAPDCGPDETERTELVYKGKINNLPVTAWRSGSDLVVRGGSAANGAGGPWATGGITGPSPVPGNSVDQPDPLVSNLAAVYSISQVEQTYLQQVIDNPELVANSAPIDLLGIT